MPLPVCRNTSTWPAEEQFAKIIARGREVFNVKFRNPCERTNESYFGKIVRAMIGLPNRRDAGLAARQAFESTRTPALSMNDAVII
jgi:hypothetical protein